MTDRLTVVPDPGLGNSAYLVNLGDGRALAVDASRDLRRLEREADARGLRIAYAADTHLHADFLSGAVQLTARHGTEVLASRAGRREFPHRGLGDGDEVDLGGLTLRALATPGHTDEHLAFLLLDGARPLGVFTGGSLIVGSAARVDLVDPDRTEELARAQYHSVRRLAQLAPETGLWPTHGGGSFCSTAATEAGTVSTVGDELARNPLLQAADEETFVQQLLGTLGSHPPYFRRLGEHNRRGPAVLPDRPLLPALAPERVADLLARGGVLVDARPVTRFAAGHPRGAVSIPLRPAFASWLGWLVPPDRPLVVVRDPDQDLDDLLWQALKIGYENLASELTGGPASWQAAGLPTEVLPVVDPRATADVRLLDVRQRAEYVTGHVPGAEHVELGDLAGRAAELAGQPVAVMCGHGERAAGAASLLTRAGGRDVRLVLGGPADVAAARGLALQDGA